MKNFESPEQEPLFPKKPDEEKKSSPDKDPFKDPVFRRQGKHYIKPEEELTEKETEPRMLKYKGLSRKKVAKLAGEFIKNQEEKERKKSSINQKK